MGIDYSDLVLPNTGEHLTKERFDELHNSNTAANGADLFQYTGDGGQSDPSPAGDDCQRWHSRPSSQRRNYSRVLAQYVREKGTITLMDALRKMSLMPAEMLERSTPAARQKGRLQEGADADIVVFDAATIADRSTFAKPMEPSVGVRYLVVGGTIVVDEGKIVPDVFPGRALLGAGKRCRKKIHTAKTNSE
jgi:N-acyl-D-aspartate/D-glutamate deacylase